MRRFLAFITMAITIVLAICFNVQVVLDNKNLSSEYGGGTEFVYQITQRENVDSSQFNENNIEEQLTDRFELLGINDANIELLRTTHNQEVSYEARIKAGISASENITSVNYVMTKNGELSFCTSAEECKSQSELLAEGDFATLLTSSDGSQVPGLSVKDKTAWDDLVTKSGEVTQEAGKNKIFVWLDKTENDTYDKAYDEEEPDLAMQDKILFELSSDSYDEENNVIILTTNPEGQAFTSDTARNYVRALNAESYDFDIKFMYNNKFDATLGENAFLYSILAMYGFLLLGLVIATIFYGVAGLIASISSIATSTLLIYLFSVFGFTLSPAVFVGIGVIFLLSMFITANYFERVKDELKKGRKLDKANREGYHKSFLTTVDSCLIVCLASLLTFAIGNGMVANMAAVIFIGSFLAFIVTNYLTKWMMYWLTSGEKYKNKESIYGLKAKDDKLFSLKNVSVQNEDGTVQEKVETNFKTKKLGIIGGAVGGVIALGTVACMLGFGLSGAGLYAEDSNYTGNSYITIQANLHDYDTSSTLEIFDNENNFNNYLANTDNIRGEKEPSVLPESYINMTFNVDNTVIDEEKGEFNRTVYISYQVEDDAIENSFIDQMRLVLDGIDIQDDNPIEVNYGRTTEVLNSYYLNSIYLVSSLCILWSTLYIFARFGISAATGNLAFSSVSTLLAYLVMTLFRVPFNAYTAISLVIIPLVLSFVLMPLFKKNNELLVDRKLKKVATPAQRVETMVQALNFNFSINKFFVTVTCTTFLILLATLTETVLPFPLISLCCILVGIVLSFVLVPVIYLAIRTNLSFKKFSEKREQRRIQKNKKPSRRQQRIKHYEELEGRGPQETIIPGLNDFH